MEQKKNTLTYLKFILECLYKDQKQDTNKMAHSTNGYKERLNNERKNLQETNENLAQIRENSSQRKQVVEIIERAKHESGETYSKILTKHT